MAAREKKYDTLFTNLMLIDGSGLPAYGAAIGVKGDTIVDVGDCRPGDAAKIIDCTGLFAAPGFIDIHNHSDEDIFYQPEARNYTAQGVTTLVAGNCGMSFAPCEKSWGFLPQGPLGKAFTARDGTVSFAQYIKALGGQSKAVNIAALVGHGNIRRKVMGLGNKKPTKAHMAEMKRQLEEALQAGAFGMSTGLIYDPGLYAHTDELIELAKVLKTYDALYTTHMRNESDTMVEAVLETLRIGKESGARVQISHHKAMGKKNWGMVETSLRLMQYFAAHGVDVACDVYPCVCGNTSLYATFPAQARDNGKKAFLDYIKNPKMRKKVRDDLAGPGMGWENLVYNAGFERVTISYSEKMPQYIGKTLQQISGELGKEPYEAMLCVIEEDPEIEIILCGMHEKDMRRVLVHPLSMVGSDGSAIAFDVGQPHPRNYRAFTKTLALHARDEGLFSLETAIQKMTSFPARRLKIQDRGFLKPGYRADIAIFDLWNLRYRSEYPDPHHYSEGMVHVMVNGGLVIADSAFTGLQLGRTLVKGGH